MADNMEEELKKLKVPELKQALKDKGLASSGTKTDLIKRLIESEVASGDCADPVIDEDEILKDDSTPAVPAAAPTSPPKASPVKVAAASNGVATTSSEPKPNIQVAADSTVAAKPTEVNKLTDAERLKMRAEKFGASSEQAKKDLRAQRFGIALSENKSGNISSSTGPVDVEKLKKRADRFGVSTSSVTEDEKKRKRAERFNTGLTTTTTTSSKSISLNSTDSELDAKKRKRAERFGLT